MNKDRIRRPRLRGHPLRVQAVPACPPQPPGRARVARLVHADRRARRRRAGARHVVNVTPEASPTKRPCTTITRGSARSASFTQERGTYAHAWNDLQTAHTWMLMHDNRNNLDIRMGVDVCGQLNNMVRRPATATGCGSWATTTPSPSTFCPACSPTTSTWSCRTASGATRRGRPVVNGGELPEDDDGMVWQVAADLPEDDLTEIWSAGSAGMLVKRHVFDAVGDPWFTPAPDAIGLNEDINFCRKVRRGRLQDLVRLGRPARPHRSARRLPAVPRRLLAAGARLRPAHPPPRPDGWIRCRHEPRPRSPVRLLRRCDPRTGGDAVDALPQRRTVPRGRRAARSSSVAGYRSTATGLATFSLTARPVRTS